VAKITSLSERQYRLSEPVRLKPVHDLNRFESSESILNDWLRKHALKASDGDTAKTYVATRGPRRVVAFYSLAAGAVELVDASGALRRNAPDPVPVIVLARIAVDRDEAGQGLGSALIADALKKSLRAANTIGAKAVLVHALNHRLIGFYEKHGFRPIDGDEQTLYLPMKTIRANL
jgi:GNAT superfamily N-acetyltransferase